MLGVFFQQKYYVKLYKLVMLSNFFIVPVAKEKIKVKLALAIPTGAPTTLADEMIQTLLLVALKTIKVLIQ